MDGVTLGIIFGLIAMFGYGLSNSVTKVPVLKIGSMKTLFFRNVFSSIILFIMLLFYIPQTNFSGIYILYVFFLYVLGYISTIAFFKALGMGKLGIISPIANSSVIFTILLSVIFFKEVLSGSQIFSIIFIILGIILISINFNDLKNSHIFEISSGVPYALVTCLLWGIMFALIKTPVMIIGPVLTSFIIEFGILMCSGIHLKISKISFAVPDHKTLFYIFIVAFFGAVATLSFNMGVVVCSVSIVTVLSNSNPLVAALYGRFVYKEKLSLQQWIALLLILTGIICMSFF